MLRVTCPRCSTQLQVQRPNAALASVCCSGCKQNFTFRVPLAATTTEVAFDGDASPFDFADLPAAPVSSGSPPPAAAGPVMASRRPLATKPPIAGGSRTHRPSTRHERSTRPPLSQRRRRWLPLVAIGGGAVSLLALVLIGGYLLVRLFPEAASHVSLFDSAEAIVQSADEVDREIIEIADQIESSADRQLLLEQLTEVTERAQRLVQRAVALSPLDPDRATALVADATDEADPFSGPLDERARETVLEQLQTLDDKRKPAFRALIVNASGKSRFVREYLQHGHLELPTPVFDGERIAAERVRSMREVNELLAKRVAKIDPDDYKPEEGELPKTPTDEESAARWNKIFGPIADDIDRIAERLFALAEARYELPESEVGNDEQYEEALFYADQARARIFAIPFLPDLQGVPFLDAFRSLAAASRDLDLANRGSLPSRLADAATRQAEAERIEQERLARIEQDKRRRAAEAEAIERQQAEQRRAEQVASRPPAEEDLVSGDPGSRADERGGVPQRQPGFAASGRPDRFGPSNDFFDQQSQRFGDDASADAADEDGWFVPSGRGFAGPTFRGPRFRSRGSAGPDSRGPGGPEFGGPRFRGPGFPGGFDRTPIDTTTGVTIKMKDAVGISTGDVVKKLSPLRSRTSASISNGELTVKTSYTGSLSKVAELIDFAEVDSIDEQNRTITLKPLP